jgi:His-Xaa-Ser system radical SAM maturase HxsB
LARTFYTIDTYGGKPAEYGLLPFRFTRLNDQQSVVVNDVGDYVLLGHDDVGALARHRLQPGTQLYKTLKAKHFLYDADSAPLLDVLATKYRTKKSFLNGFSRLHIFVVTLRCEHSCHYCQVSRQSTDRSRYDMTPETAERSLQLMMRSPAKAMTLELQGGEPLLAFDTIRWIVPRAKELAAQHSKDLQIVVTTNLAVATPDILRYFRDEGIRVSTSLDGPAYIHNKNRSRPGNDSYERAIQNINLAREILGLENVAAVMTTTQLSLDHPIEIVDEYVRQDFHSIFLRSISPYGFAVKTRKKTGYQMDRFLEFYKTAFEHILKLNLQGIPLVEVYASLLFTKMLTPFSTGYVDLQSPAGAGISVLVYNYDGDVYATDEARMLAEMNDHSFRLGNVHRDSYEAIYNGPAFQRLTDAACNESLPGCSQCAFQPYCGADPVFHHATQGDLYGHRPTSAFCDKNIEIIKYLFEKLATADRNVMRVFFEWIRGQRIADSEVDICA